MSSGPLEENLEGCLLPAQYNSLVRRTCYGSEAEKSLLLAVLMDAIRIYLADRRANTRERRVRFEETRRWFEEAPCGGGREIFAFENLCAALGVNADRLRARLGLIPRCGNPATASATRGNGRKERR
jgi:hypothetical protein